jgi:hypothetical protein
MLQLQRILTKTSTWTQRRLTDSTSTQRANSHTLDSLTLQALPDNNLNETTSTAPRHHLSYQRSSSSTALPTTAPRRLFHVTSSNDDRPHGVIVVHPVTSPTDYRPEALVGSSPRGKSVASNPQPCSDINCWDCLQINHI